MAASFRVGYPENMKIAFPFGLRFSEWGKTATRAWLAGCLGQLVFAPIRSGRRMIASAPRFCLARAMGDAV